MKQQPDPKDDECIYENGMLVLSCKKGQSILIGDNIELRVSKIDGNLKVSIAVKAPKEVMIYRQELLEELQKGIKV